MIHVQDLESCPMSQNWKVAKSILDPKYSNFLSSAQSPYLGFHPFLLLLLFTSIINFHNFGKCINARDTKVLSPSNF